MTKRIYLSISTRCLQGLSALLLIGLARAALPPVHIWGENDRQGTIGQIFQNKDNPNHSLGYFRLIALGKDGRYWYYPSKANTEKSLIRRVNAWWVYLGDTPAKAEAANASYDAILRDFHTWGENDRKGKINDVYFYPNPYTGRLKLYRLKALGRDGRYWYFPTKPEEEASNPYWKDAEGLTNINDLAYRAAQGTIGAQGGTVTLAGVATLQVPAGGLPAGTPVKLEQPNSLESATQYKLFNEPLEHDPLMALDLIIHLNTNQVGLDGMTLTIQIPPEMQALYAKSGGYQVGMHDQGAFTGLIVEDMSDPMNLDAGWGEGGSAMKFQYDPVKQTITFNIPLDNDPELGNEYGQKAMMKHRALMKNTSAFMENPYAYHLSALNEHQMYLTLMLIPKKEPEPPPTPTGIRRSTLHNPLQPTLPVMDAAHQIRIIAPYGWDAGGTSQIESMAFKAHASAWHSGIDIRAAEGTPLYAAGDGYISRLEIKNKDGRCDFESIPLTCVGKDDKPNNPIQNLEIKLDDGSKVRYMHIRRGSVLGSDGNALPPGQHMDFNLSSIPQNARARYRVRMGQRLAYSSDSGITGAPHLHLEYIPPRETRAINPILVFGTLKTNSTRLGRPNIWEPYVGTTLPNTLLLFSFDGGPDDTRNLDSAAYKGQEIVVRRAKRGVPDTYWKKGDCFLRATAIYNRAINASNAPVLRVSHKTSSPAVAVIDYAFDSNGDVIRDGHAQALQAQFGGPNCPDKPKQAVGPASEPILPSLLQSNNGQYYVYAQRPGFANIEYTVTATPSHVGDAESPAPIWVKTHYSGEIKSAQPYPDTAPPRVQKALSYWNVYARSTFNTHSEERLPELPEETDASEPIQ